MHQDKNGVPVPWAWNFEEAAKAHPELQIAIDLWFARMDGPGHPDGHEVWAEVSCAIMMHLARLAGISRRFSNDNDNPLSNSNDDGHHVPRGTSISDNENPLSKKNVSWVDDTKVVFTQKGRAAWGSRPRRRIEEP
jgi:hypothetical protein